MVFQWLSGLPHKDLGIVVVRSELKKAALASHAAPALASHQAASYAAQPVWLSVTRLLNVIFNTDFRTSVQRAGLASRPGTRTPLLWILEGANRAPCNIEPCQSTAVDLLRPPTAEKILLQAHSPWKNFLWSDAKLSAGDTKAYQK